MKWNWFWPESLFRDARIAVRQLLRNPGFTLVVGFTLVLAIGLNTAVFTVVNALLLRPLPYLKPERLGAVITHFQGANQHGQTVASDDDSIDGETWELIRDNVTSVRPAVWSGVKGVNLQTSTSVQYVREQRVSARYFEVLGTRVLIGRSFSENEDRPHGPKAVVLSYHLWMSLFSSDPQIVGQTIHLKGEPYLVVGVLASQLPSAARADLWTPLQPSREGEGRGSNYGCIIRLRDGASWQQARTELSQLRPSLFDNFKKAFPGITASLSAVPLQQDLAAQARIPALVLMFAVLCILLIACANLAGLMLVRIGRRTAELSTRLALGATHMALLRQIMLEPLLLGLAGGLMGYLLSAQALEWLRGAIDPGMLPPGGLAADGTVLGFTLAASLAAVLMIGILPALELRHVDIRSSMSSGTVRAPKFRTRQVLIAGEVMLTLVLLSTAGLLIRTLVHLQTLPPGFDATNVMTAKLSLDDARYHDASAFHKLLEDSVSSMKQIPGVESAAIGLSLPYERGLNDGFTIIDGANAGSGSVSCQIYVTPEYFRVLRLALLAGRTLTQADTAESEAAAVVDQSFAVKYLGGIAGVGRHVKTGGKVFSVVGIVADVTKVPGLEQTAPLATEPTIYVPATQMSQPVVNMAHVWYQPSWVVRTSGPITGLPAAMQQALAQADPSLPFAGFHSMGDIEAVALRQQRVEVVLLAIFSGLALVLSLVGLYGLVSTLVMQRTREIGIRMALGSTVVRAMAETGRSGMVAVAFGMGAGLMLAALTLRIVRSQLYGVRTFDPASLIVVCGLLILAASAASFLPARRIARINPASSLRAE
ncbi:MAG TPA: ADOP family duplicated permease [Candidatus Angelobacter sp.]|nr:ADOP family duplicated permease [Candidatus Angelobacter sp.]